MRGRTQILDTWVCAISLVLLLVLVISPGEAHSQGLTVRVGVYQNMPKVFFTDDGQATGIFIDLLAAIAAQENWELVYIPCEWAECLKALGEGQIDLMPDVAFSEEREAEFDFHEIPVLDSWSSIYSSPEVFLQSLSDLDGRQVAVLQGSIQQTVFEKMVAGFGYQTTIVPVASLEQGFALASEGTVDAAIANRFFGDYFYREYHLAKTAIVFNPVMLYYATAEGRNHDLLEAIDRWLEKWLQEPHSPYYTIISHWTEKEPLYHIPEHIFWITGGITGLLMVFGGMILLLRQQVRSRTRHLEKANLELKSSEQRYQTLTRISPVGIFRTDTDGATTYVNPRWCEIAGLSFEDALGDGWLSVVHPQDRNRIRSGWQESTQRHEPSVEEYRFLRPDGSISWVMGQAVPELDAKGHLTGYVGTTTDITERKLAEEEIFRRIKELNGLYQVNLQVSQSLALDEVISGAISKIVELTEADLGFIFLREQDRLLCRGMASINQSGSSDQKIENRLGEKLCGLAMTEGVPLYAAQISEKAPSIWEEWYQAGYKSFVVLPLRIEDESIGALGFASQEPRDFERQAGFLETMVGQVSIGIYNAQLHAQVQRHSLELEQRVVQRTKELEIAMQKAQEADRLKSAFLATMSHELRTPLNSIIGFTGVLLQGLAGPLNPEQEKQLGMTRDSARHLLALINDILDISKIEANQLEVAHASFDMRTAIENALRLVRAQAQKKNLALSATIASDVGSIISDRRRVEQILINLLNNAIKFTERGEVGVQCQKRGKWLEISVRDTGIGMRAEELGKIFEPFQQLDSGISRSYEGTGLGLAICRNLVKLLGGEISVSSEWGVGSVFTFTLPLNLEEMPDGENFDYRG